MSSFSLRRHLGNRVAAESGRQRAESSPERLASIQATTAAAAAAAAAISDSPSTASAITTASNLSDQEAVNVLDARKLPGYVPHSNTQKRNSSRLRSNSEAASAQSGTTTQGQCVDFQTNELIFSIPDSHQRTQAELQQQQQQQPQGSAHMRPLEDGGGSVGTADDADDLQSRRTDLDMTIYGAGSVAESTMDFSTSKFDTSALEGEDEDTDSDMFNDDEAHPKRKHGHGRTSSKDAAIHDDQDDSDDSVVSVTEEDKKQLGTHYTYRMKKVLRRLRREQDADELIELYTNNQAATREAWRGWFFPSNYIRTTHYTILTFLPKNLFEQFRRLSNLYFLLQCVLTQIPGVTPILSWSSIFPLLVILLVNGIKDIFEDVRRYISDRRANRAPTAILRNGQFMPARVSDVKLGDIVRVDCDREVPADLIIISSSRDDGRCYIETANLDGETNLKTKKAIAKFAHLRDDKSIFDLRYKIYVEQPNEHLDQFQGKAVPLMLPEAADEIRAAMSMKYNTSTRRGGEMSHVSSSSTLEQQQQQQHTLTQDDISAIAAQQVDAEKQQQAATQQVGESGSAGEPSSPATAAEGAPPTIQPTQQVPSSSVSPQSSYQPRLPHTSFSTSTTPRSSHMKKSKSNPFSLVLHKHKPRKIKAQGNYVELDEQSIPLIEENFALRGCIVRNTKHVYGIAVYVGRSTKLFKNLKTKKLKRLSGLDRRINAMIFLIIFIQLVLTALFVLLSSLFQNQYTNISYYLASPGLSDFLFVLKSCVTYFVVLSFFVPTSLFVSHEIVKVAQVGHMERDPEMKHNGVSMSARTSQLNQELSQIDVVISDKTGTLTENKMIFKKCWVHGYVHNEFEDAGGLGRLFSQTAFSREQQKQQELARHLLMCIALNHSVVPERDVMTDEIVFHGQSSDEIALLKFAKSNGYNLVQSNNDGLEIEINGERQYFEILETIPFSSDRKRMSVFIKGPTDDTIIMYCKGADTVMFPRSLSSPLVAEASRALNHFSMEGLRTLVFCYKIIGLQEFESWQRRFQQASCASKHREKKVNEVASEMEIEMLVSGCSGIEDKLQDGVPEAVEFLRKAGLQLWVLTGDKTQTAVNIAYSARILTKGVTREIKIRAKRRIDCKRKLKRALQYVHDNKGQMHERPFAVIIDSKALKYALKRYRNQFIELVSRCQSCICCRVTPLQKAKVTALVNKQLKRKSLAIGDGANDVSMIQEAMIGVGIIGNEGSQAARASDYAIHRFKHLPRLMAVYGRYSYVGNSDFLHLSIWKNFILGIIQLFFSIFSGYSGMIPIDNWVLQFYNSIFTSLPPGAQGGFERDLNPEVLLRHPELYKDYKNDALFNIKTVITWMIMSIYHSCAIFFIYFALAWGDSGLLGMSAGQMRQGDLWSDSFVFTTATFLVTIFKCALMTKYWSWFHCMSYTVSLTTYFAFSFLYGLFPDFFGYGGYYFAPMMAFTSPKAWLSLMLIVVVTMLPDLTVKLFRRNLFPSNWEKVLLQDYWERKLLKKRKKSCKVRQDDTCGSSELQSSVETGTTCVGGPVSALPDHHKVITVAVEPIRRYVNDEVTPSPLPSLLEAPLVAARTYHHHHLRGDLEQVPSMPASPSVLSVPTVAPLLDASSANASFISASTSTAEAAEEEDDEDEVSAAAVATEQTDTAA